MFEETFRVYGVRKSLPRRRPLSGGSCRESGSTSPVAGLMRLMGGAAQGSGDAQHCWDGCGGLAGVICGKPVRTTVSDKAALCLLDRLNRQFRAPEPKMLWVSGFAYVATWAGFVYAAFVIDTYTRRIVG